jgi:hypothetical protein
MPLIAWSGNSDLIEHIESLLFQISVAASRTRSGRAVLE